MVDEQENKLNALNFNTFSEIKNTMFTIRRHVKSRHIMLIFRLLPE